MKTAGIVVGRFNPIHLGHVKTIDAMIESHNVDNSLIIIGSSNNQISLKNPLNYRERRELIKNIYPNIRVIGLADQKEDSDWSMSLTDILTSVFPNQEIFIYTGSYLDIEKFELPNIKTKIIDRRELNISATSIRNRIYTHILLKNYRAEFLSYLKDVIPTDNIWPTMDKIEIAFGKLMREEYD